MGRRLSAAERGKMKSIRRSLTVYLLLLLAAALGPVSLVAYKSIQAILETSKAAQRELLRMQFKNRSRDEDQKLDRMLRMQARLIARQAQFQRDLSFMPLGLLGTGLDPSSGLLAPIWL